MALRRGLVLARLSPLWSLGIEQSNASILCLSTPRLFSCTSSQRRMAAFASDWLGRSPGFLRAMASSSAVLTSSSLSWVSSHTQIRLHSGSSSAGGEDAHASVCWKCSAATPPAEVKEKKSIPEDFCSACETIQPPDRDVSPFDLLSAPRQFNLDFKAIEKTYLQLQRKMHPDFYQAKSKMEQVYAEARSSQLNKAYQVLKSPIRRAQLLLAEAGAAMGEENTEKSDPVLLLRIFEMRETLDETPADAHDKLRSMRAEIAAEIDEAAQLFNSKYSSGDLIAAKTAVGRMTYLTKMVNLINERLPIE